MGTQETNPSSPEPEPQGEAADADVSSVLDSIRRIVRDLRVASRAAEKAVGLSAAQLFVLHKLAEGPVTSLNELADRTSTDQSSVSVVVRRLADARLLRRQQSGADGRCLEISLAPKARALLEKAPTAAQERIIAALGRMPAHSRRQLARLLEGLVQELGIDTGSAGMLFEEEAAHQSHRTRPSRQSRPPGSSPASQPTQKAPSSHSPSSHGRNKRNARSG